MKNFNKMRGGYYTPISMAKYLCDWAVTDINQTALEPSCGDGNILEALIESYKNIKTPINQIEKNILAIEYIADEAEKSRKRISHQQIKNPENIVINNDFFTEMLNGYFDKENNYEITKTFDLVVENPPFIKSQIFPKDQKEKAFEIMKAHGFKPSGMTNSWLTFMIT